MKIDDMGKLRIMNWGKFFLCHNEFWKESDRHAYSVLLRSSQYEINLKPRYCKVFLKWSLFYTINSLDYNGVTEFPMLESLLDMFDEKTLSDIAESVQQVTRPIPVFNM